MGIKKVVGTLSPRRGDQGGRTPPIFSCHSLVISCLTSFAFVKKRSKKQTNKITRCSEVKFVLLILWRINYVSSLELCAFAGVCIKIWLILPMGATPSHLPFLSFFIILDPALLRRNIITFNISLQEFFPFLQKKQSKNKFCF